MPKERTATFLYGTVTCLQCGDTTSVGDTDALFRWVQTHPHLAKPQRPGLTEPKLAPAKPPERVLGRCPHCGRLIRGLAGQYGNTVRMRPHGRTGSAIRCPGKFGVRPRGQDEDD